MSADSVPPALPLLGASLLLAGVGVVIASRRAQTVAASAAGIALGSAGAGTLWRTYVSAGGPILADAAHLAAALCCLWSVVGVFILPRRGESDAPSLNASASVCRSTALVFGTITVVLLAYPLTYASLQRLFGEAATINRVATHGAIALAALLLAALLWRRAARDEHQPAAILLLAAVLVAWCGLLIPAPSAAYGANSPASWSVSMEWWSWIAHLQASHALLVFAGFLWFRNEIRRRAESAWPDRLEQLLDLVPRWAGYFQAVAVLAAIVLLLSVYQLVRGGPPSWLLLLVGVVATFLAGAACFFLATSAWSANLFGLGAALITSAVGTLPLMFVPASGTLSSRTPIVLNAALFGLVFMTFLWFWLHRFWRQQLLDGQPWTTAGRAIPYVWRTGFLVAGLSILVMFQMSVWPAQLHVVAPDDSVWRWTFGLAAIFLYCLVTASESIRHDSPPVAAMSLAGVAAAGLFSYARWDDPLHRGWILQYLPLVLSILALPVFALSESVRGSRARSFASPLWAVAVVGFPAAALLGVLPTARLPAEWVRPLTLTAVGALFALAARREGRRAFYGLSAVLMLAAALILLRILGRVIV